MIDYSNIQVGEEPYFPVMSWATAGFEQTEQLPNSILTNYIVLESEYKEDLYFTGGVACLVGVCLLGAREIQVILVTSVLVSTCVLMPVFSSEVDRIRQTG